MVGDLVNSVGIPNQPHAELLLWISEVELNNAHTCLLAGVSFHKEVRSGLDH